MWTKLFKLKWKEPYSSLQRLGLYSTTYVHKKTPILTSYTSWWHYHSTEAAAAGWSRYENRRSLLAPPLPSPPLSRHGCWCWHQAPCTPSASKDIPFLTSGVSESTVYNKTTQNKKMQNSETSGMKSRYFWPEILPALHSVTSSCDVQVTWPGTTGTRDYT